MQKFYIIPVVSILIVLAIGLLVIQPKINEIMELSEKTETERSNNTKLTAKRDAMVSLSANEQEIIAKLNSVRVGLPDEKNITQYLLELDKLSQASNISIRSVQVTPGILVEKKPTIGQAADELTLNIAVDGNFESIKTFLQRAFKAKRLINTDNITISINSETDGSVNATGIFNIYYKKRPQIPTDFMAEVPVLTDADNKLFTELESFTSYAQ